MINRQQCFSVKGVRSGVYKTHPSFASDTLPSLPTSYRGSLRIQNSGASFTRRTILSLAKEYDPHFSSSNRA